MSDARNHGLTRRQFHAASAATAALPFAARPVATVPDRRRRDKAHHLIVLELVGGNDGLNTVIPNRDPRYRNARPRLSQVLQDAHEIGDGFSLHPSMPEFAALYEKGLVGIAQGVGVNPPDRSHFKSRDIWHTGDPTLEKVTGADTGWLGRIGDALVADGVDTPSLALGQGRLPLCLRGKDHTPPLLNDPKSLRLREGADPDGAKMLVGGGARDDSLESFLGGLADQARELEQRLQKAFEQHEPKADFLRGEGGSLGRSLSSITRLIAADFGTRLFHVPLDGFDTHSRQLDAHANLLQAVSKGLGALVSELASLGALDRTTILVHSEFGRRVRENESEGTDHGAGGPCFVVGGGVRGGLHGETPDLGDLLEGDVRPTTDFRSVYRALVARLGIAPERVFDLEKRDRGIEAAKLFA